MEEYVNSENEVLDEVNEAEIIMEMEDFPTKDRMAGSKKRSDDYRAAIKKRNLCNILGLDKLHSKGLHQLVKGKIELPSFRNGEITENKKTNSKYWGFQPSASDKRKLDRVNSELKEINSSETDSVESE